MKIFSYLYSKTLQWSSHHHAPYYLAGVSFAESSFFPIPPDVMLISMGLATPKRSWKYAFIATLFSVIGGLFGYLLGFYAMELIEPYILSSSYANSYHIVRQWFEHSGVGIVILAAFTPFPYKLFTLTAGALNMALFPFVVGSIVGRGLRFFLVSTILYYTGAKLEAQLRRYIDVMGWGLLGIIVIAYAIMKWIL